MTRASDTSARLRAAFTGQWGEAPSPQACPAPETIWKGARGELPPGEVREVVDHLAACPSCAEDWRLAVALEEGAAGKVLPMPASRLPARRVGYWVAAAVAAALVAVVGLRLGDGLFDGRPPSYRGGGEEAAIRSLVPEDAVLPRAQFVLRWEPVPGAGAYGLVVSTEDLRVLAVAEDLAAPQYEVPEEAFARLPAGTKIDWQVEVQLADGRRLASETFRVGLE